MSRQAAAVYRAGDVFRVVADDISTMGVGLARDRIETLDRPSDEELGVAILEALGQSGRVVPHPATQAEWSARTRALVRAMGYRSHRALMAENEVVEVRGQDAMIEVFPTENRGVKGGYSHRPVAALRVPQTPVIVGRTVRAAMAPDSASRDIR